MSPPKTKKNRLRIKQKNACWATCVDQNSFPSPICWAVPTIRFAAGLRQYRPSLRCGSSPKCEASQMRTTVLVYKKNTKYGQLWPEIPIRSTNTPPFLECIIQFVTSYNQVALTVGGFVRDILLIKIP